MVSKVDFVASVLLQNEDLANIRLKWTFSLLNPSLDVPTNKYITKDVSFCLKELKELSRFGAD